MLTFSAGETALRILQQNVSCSTKVERRILMIQQNVASSLKPLALFIFHRPSCLERGVEEGGNRKPAYLFARGT